MAFECNALCCFAKLRGLSPSGPSRDGLAPIHWRVLQIIRDAVVVPLRTCFTDPFAFDNCTAEPSYVFPVASSLVLQKPCPFYPGHLLFSFLSYPRFNAASPFLCHECSLFTICLSIQRLS